MSIQAGNIGITLLAVGLGALGLLLLAFGLWPRRRGDTPYCRKCGYRLTGLTSERCPECGRLLADDGVVHGEVRRKPLLAVLSIFLLILSGLTTVGIVRQFDIYPYLPTFWIISFDLESGNTATVARAWAELMQRDTDGKLPIRATRKLIDACLKNQPSAPGLPNVRQHELDFLGNCYLKGRLMPAQEELFFSRMVQPTLGVRERVNVGDKCPYHVQLISQGPQGFRCKVSPAEILLDGIRLPGHGGGSILTMGGGGGSIGSELPASVPGERRVVVLVEATILRPDGQVCHTCKHRIECTFEVLPADLADSLHRIHDPTLHMQLQPRIRITQLERSSRGGLDGVVSFDPGPYPCPLAFEVIARVNGTEYPVGTTTRSTTDSTAARFGIHSRNSIPVAETVDIILRGSEKAARGTVDMYEFWDGELVYHDVPVRMPATAPAADN
jgi:hypothetical protein